MFCSDRHSINLFDSPSLQSLANKEYICPYSLEKESFFTRCFYWRVIHYVKTFLKLTKFSHGTLYFVDISLYFNVLSCDGFLIKHTVIYNTKFKPPSV